MECDECRGKMVKKKVDFQVYGVALGKFDALVCPHCSQALFSEEASARIDDAAKAKGLWGLESRTKVAQAGDSLSIRVNKRLAAFLDLKKGEEVTLVPESRRRVIVSR